MALSEHPFFLYICLLLFGATPSGAQDLFLALCSGITPSRLRAPFVVPEITLESAVYMVNILCVVPCWGPFLLWKFQPPKLPSSEPHILGFSQPLWLKGQRLGLAGLPA